MHHKKLMAIAVAVIFAAGLTAIAEETKKAASFDEEEPAVETAKAPATTSALKVKEAKFGTEVVDRQPTGVQEDNVFGTNVSRLYYWTVITGAHEPTTVTHTWFFNDEQMAEVELAVRFAHMRTWSSKVILPKEGKWRVLVKDASGNILKEASATISSKKSTPPPVPADQKTEDEPEAAAEETAPEETEE